MAEIIPGCRHDYIADREWEHANDQWPLSPTEEVFWSQKPHPRTEGKLLTERQTFLKSPYLVVTCLWQNFFRTGPHEGPVFWLRTGLVG
jgi:hypothetical protein